MLSVSPHLPQFQNPEIAPSPQSGNWGKSPDGKNSLIGKFFTGGVLQCPNGEFPLIFLFVLQGRHSPMAEFFPGTSIWHIFRLGWTAAEEKVLVFWRMCHLLTAFCQNVKAILTISSKISSKMNKYGNMKLVQYSPNFLHACCRSLSWKWRDGSPHIEVLEPLLHVAPGSPLAHSPRRRDTKLQR